MQWKSASRQVEILRKLYDTASRTFASEVRWKTPFPTSTTTLVPNALALAATTGPSVPAMNADMSMPSSWTTLWASMPSSADDLNPWQQCLGEITL